MVALVTFLSKSDPATSGLDTAAGVAATALVLATGVPALVLGWADLAPRLALMLALAFPIGAALLFATILAALG